MFFTVASLLTFEISRYESTEDGYEPKEKKEELFDQQSRFIILRTPDSPNPFAYGMFRFDTEETMGDKYAQVLYW